MEKILDFPTADGFNLKAIISLPKKARKMVLMCHGISSHKQEYLDMFPRLAELLFKQDIGAIRFDFRGHGDSSGNNTDFSIVSQIIDLDTIVNSLRQHEEFKDIPFSFVGVSFGGAPGIIYQKIYNCFQEISLFAPVLSFEKTFVSPITSWGKTNFNNKAWLKAKKTGSILLDGEFEVSLRLLTEFLLIEPLLFLSEIKVPLQIFHGDKDSLVPASITEKIAKDYPAIDVRLIEDMGHGLYVDGDDEGETKESLLIQEHYFKTTLDFLS